MAHPRSQRPAKVHLALGLLLTLAACQSTPELDRGDRLLAEGKPAEAIEFWRQSLARNPDSAKLLIRIATAQSRLGRLGDAAATMHRAVAIEPDSPRVRHNLALVYLKQKKFDAALATFHQALALQNTYPQTNYYVGLIHEMRGDEETAVRYYVREVNNGPCLRAWQRLQLYKEKQRELGLAPREPEPSSVMLVGVAFFSVAALAYALRLYLDARHKKATQPPRELS